MFQAGINYFNPQPPQPTEENTTREKQEAMLDEVRKDRKRKLKKAAEARRHERAREAAAAATTAAQPPSGFYAMSPAGPLVVPGFSAPAVQATLPASPGVTPSSRGELAIRRFAEFCRNDLWGILLFHKVGTGKTITSLLIALNYMPDRSKRIVIVSPPGIYANFQKELTLISNETNIQMVSYEYDDIAKDINEKNFYKLEVFRNSIVIFDEAHRLLLDVIKTSSESGSDLNRHSIIEDFDFQQYVYEAARCIVMTGTPLQKNFADICRFLNFVTRSQDFTVSKYAKKTTEQFRDEKMLYMKEKILRLFGRNIDKIITIIFSYFAAAPVAAVATTWSVLGFILEVLDIPTNTKSLLRAVGQKFVIESQLAEIQELQELLQTNIYDIPAIAEAAAPYISLYDYELQGEFKDLLTNIRAETNTPRYRLSRKNFALVPRERFTQQNIDFLTQYDFPKKKMEFDFIGYTGFQFNLLSRLYAGVLDLNEREIFYLDLYPNPSRSVGQNKTLAWSLGRVVGNLSPSIYHYATRLSTNKLSYDIIRRSDGLKMDPLIPGTFQNPKFRKILEYLRYSASGKTMSVKSSLAQGGEAEFTEEQIEDTYETRLAQIVFAKENNLIDPNIQGIDDVSVPLPGSDDLVEKIEPAHEVNGNIYLPIVYSYNENLGTSLFAAYLQSLGLKYILIHQDQKFIPKAESELPADVPNSMKSKIKTELALQTWIAENRTYAKVPYTPTARPESIVEGWDKNRPICILLHPKMTEGIDLKYNPEIILMDVCNNFGDMEQIHGRVLRRYKPDDIAKMKTGPNAGPRRKVIRQMFMITKTDANFYSRNINSYFRGLRNWGNKYFTAASSVLQRYKETGFHYSFSNYLKIWITLGSSSYNESPDLNRYKKIMKEKTNILDFSKLLTNVDYKQAIECRKRVVPRAPICSPQNLKKGKCVYPLRAIGRLSPNYTYRHNPYLRNKKPFDGGKRKTRKLRK